METKGRTNDERGRNVWLLVTTGGKLIDKFRTKMMANQMKKYYLNNYGWGLEIKRDNQFKEGLKEKLK